MMKWNSACNIWNVEFYNVYKLLIFSALNLIWAPFKTFKQTLISL